MRRSVAQLQTRTGSKPPYYQVRCLNSLKRGVKSLQCRREISWPLGQQRTLRPLYKWRGQKNRGSRYQIRKIAAGLNLWDRQTFKDLVLLIPLRSWAIGQFATYAPLLSSLTTELLSRKFWRIHRFCQTGDWISKFAEKHYDFWGATTPQSHWSAPCSTISLVAPPHIPLVSLP